MTNKYELLTKVPEMSTDVFWSTFGKGKRLELKNRGLPIGKMTFCIQSFDEKNHQTGFVSLYMDIAKSLVFANDILSGKIAHLAELEKKKNPDAKYPAPIFLDQGGQSAQAAKRPDGKPLYRELSLSKGQLWLLKGSQGPGAVTDTGGFKPDGKSEVSVAIGLSDEALKAMAIMIKAEYDAFRSSQYVLLALKNKTSSSDVSENTDEMNEFFK